MTVAVLLAGMVERGELGPQLLEPLVAFGFGQSGELGIFLGLRPGSIGVEQSSRRAA
jgi:hypothetical protein